MAINLEQATSKVLDNISLVKSERINLKSADHRILAEDITAPIDLPPFTYSSFDGYAFNAQDTSSASPANPIFMEVVADIPGGSFLSEKIPRGTCAKIMTGAPVPEGANAVVPQEDIQEPEQNRILIEQPYFPKQNLITKGTYIKSQEPVMPKGTCLQAGQIQLLASLGISEVKVFKKPVVGIFATGSELAPLGDSLGKAQIYDSNSSMLNVMVNKNLGKGQVFPPVPDKMNELKQTTTWALKTCDMVISTGGIGRGDHDLMPEVIKDLNSEILFQGINTKPGASTLVALKNNQLIFCLTGSPGAAALIFDQLVRPALLRKAGIIHYQRPYGEALLEHKISINKEKKQDSVQPLFFMNCFIRNGDLFARKASMGNHPKESFLGEPNAVFQPKTERDSINQGERIWVELIDLPEVK